MKIYKKLFILSLLCVTAFADHSTFDQDPQAVMAAVRTNVRLVDPFVQDSSEEPKLDLKGAEASSVFTLENFATVLKTLGNATWRSGANFTTDALEHHLGDSAAAQVAALFIQTPMGGLSYEEWATKLVANSAHKLGYISEETAANLSFSSVLLAVTSEDGISALAQLGLRMVAPQVSALLGEEIGWAAGQIAVRGITYFKWMFDGKDLQTSDVVTAKAAIEDLLPEAPTTPTSVSSMDEDEDLKAPAAQKVAAQSPVDEDTSMWGKAKTTAKRVWNKFTHSVKVGSAQAIEGIREHVTLANTKTYVVNKFKKMTGFGSSSTKASAVKATA